MAYGVRLERSDYLKLPPHADACTPEDFPAWLARRSPDERLAVDLFSGAGGLSLGLEQAGWTVALAADYDERARETHAGNFPGLSLCTDLGNPDERDRLVELLSHAEIDLVAGGPPCQPFSRAGRSKIRSLVREGVREAIDLRKELWRAYLDVILRVRPRAVLMENVPDMGLSDDFFVVRSIEQELEDAGYYTQVRLVDAWNYRVPQHRKRLILLARRDAEAFPWPRPHSRTTLRDAIEDLPPLPEGNTGQREFAYRAKAGLSEFARRMRAGAPRGRVHDHMTRPVRDDDREIFAGMDSKSSYRDVPEHLRRYDSEHFKDKYKKLDWDELSRTITAHIAKDGYWYIHPEQLRTLTVREAARVQTFPDRFRFAGNRSDAFRQIGNAVPPLLGEAAAQALLPVHTSASAPPPEPEARPYWLRVREALTAWAVRETTGPNWAVLPGPDVIPAAAALSALLTAARTAPAVVGRQLAPLRGRQRLTERDLIAVSAVVNGDRARRGIEELLIRKRERSRSITRAELPTALDMRPGEQSLFRLLTGEDLLLVGQGSLRVAARVTGSASDRTNRLSDGRVDLSKIIGAGEQAPLRMAAIRLIGSSYCRETDPMCGSCPLRAFCVKRDSLDTGATLLG
ncbi:DNA cytosine methyltransferase [Embleya scabrispora]|uniref:DNA cytosine methyltransferase n=1 Tax=Embleya scabrispora TaxID=159449 RepID=UPI001FE19858|nr:DNA cytosine methyltransferase [Embleya scabrispora]